MQNQYQRAVFRPPTQPLQRNKQRRRTQERPNQQIKDNGIVRRPQENFFKLIFQRDKYLWLIMNKNVRDGKTFSEKQLYNEMVNAYSFTNLKEQQLPICTSIQQFKKWTKLYHCSVAFDENANQWFDQVFNDSNVHSIRVINQTNVQIIKKIRIHPNGFKVRGIHDNYVQIFKQIKQDMQKVKVMTDSEKIQKVKLPNFMKLRVRDKAQLMNYRTNIYCLVNLSKNISDLKTSKKRFIEQCQKMYTTPKDINFIKYYLTYPFNDQQILRFYTEDSFFYRCINNTLRVAKTAQQFFIIGQPVNRMFHAIKNIYKKQYPYTKSRKGMKLYRGTDLSPTQTQYLQKCIGSYIQIQGFVSTTEQLATAQKFAKQRKHNKIIQIIFEDIQTENESILQNDYGFVDLINISRYQQNQVLFNTLNIFKVIGKQVRDQYQYFILQYGTIFNVLNIQNPQFLKRDDRLAYYTYKQLMGQKIHIQDLGQVFLKSNQTQKCVDYYQAKIMQAKTQSKAKQVEFTIKKSQALIQNGQPAKALQTMILLLSQRKGIKKTQGGGAKFAQQILQNKGEMIRQIDITKKYSSTGYNLDKFDQAQDKLTELSQALQDAISVKKQWDFDIAYSKVQLNMQMATCKQSVQSYKQSYTHLKIAQKCTYQILQKMKEFPDDSTFHNYKTIYFQQTLIYQMMARISSHLEGEDEVNMQQLEQKYKKTQEQLQSLIQQHSYDKSLISSRKVQILRRRQNFEKNKKLFVRTIQQSIISIKQFSSNDQELPKSYRKLAQIQIQESTVASTNNAIGYLQKQYMTNVQFYSQNDPKSMATVIQIAKCHRQIKQSNQSLELLKQQIKCIPYKNIAKHTIVTKTLYTMGMAYLDLGQYNYSLKCFQKGLVMLQQILSKKQLQKYHHKYKIQLQMGRTYTFLIRYNQAQQKLMCYHKFIVKLYQSQHSDIANSLNHFAILYLKWGKNDQAKRKFQQSWQMFRTTTGQKSLKCAKISCNLGIVYSLLGQKQKGLKQIDNARYTFNQIFIKDKDIKEKEPIHAYSHQIFYYYAQIHRKYNQFQQAILFYKQSLQTLSKYKERKKNTKDLISVSKLSNNSSAFKMSVLGMNSMVQSKRDSFQLTCRVKIIECQLKLKDFSFMPILNNLINDIQKQIKTTQKEGGQNQIMNKKAASQLEHLHQFCLHIKKNLQNRKKVKKVNQTKQAKKQDQQIIVPQQMPFKQDPHLIKQINRQF